MPRGKSRDGIVSYVRKAGAKKMVGKSNTKKGGSGYTRLTTNREDQGARTPDSIFKPLCERYSPVPGKKLDDPCPAVFDKKGNRVWKQVDALAEDHSWGTFNYVNPPYSEINKWFAKAIKEQAKGRSSVFLVPFRPYVKYFMHSTKDISFVELIFGGVGFKGYAAKIPHPMCTVTFLGKGVREKKKMHGEWTENRVAYVQRVPKPHAFDDAVIICRKYGIGDEDIHILVNSSNMVGGGWLEDRKLAMARKSWKHAYACLVPFYNYSRAFQKGFKEASVLAFSNPILSNYAGEGKCRFCSVLFVFCPTGTKAKPNKKFLKMTSESNMHKFRIFFNTKKGGYMPTDEQIAEAKIQIAKKKAKEAKMGIVRKFGRRPSKAKGKASKKKSKPKSKKKQPKKPKGKKKSKAASKKKTKKTTKADEEGFYDGSVLKKPRAPAMPESKPPAGFDTGLEGFRKYVASDDFTEVIDDEGLSLTLVDEWRVLFEIPQTSVLGVLKAHVAARKPEEEDGDRAAKRKHADVEKGAPAQKRLRTDPDPVKEVAG